MKEKANFFEKENTIKYLSSLVCILISLLIGFLILVFMSPGDAATEFGVLITGGIKYQGLQGFFNILKKTAPLLCSGLAICFAYKTGIFNIGVAGQYVMGVFGGLMFAIKFNMSWPVCLLMAMLFGAIWGAIPGLLKSFCNVNEVIGGIMLNWISLIFVNYSFQTYLSSCLDITKGSKTYELLKANPSAIIPSMNFGDSQLSISIFFAIFFAILVWFIMGKTTLGFELRASGLNRHATRYAGMNEKRNIVLSMAFAGALAGLGGGLYYLSCLEEWSAAISTNLPAVPWNGIVVAFVGQLSPIATIISSLFISLLMHGARFMSQSIYPAEIADLVTGIIVYLSGLTTFVIYLVKKYKDTIKMKGELFNTKFKTKILNNHQKIKNKLSKDNNIDKTNKERED